MDHGPWTKSFYPVLQHNVPRNTLNIALFDLKTILPR
jgi:hypothetical protein